MVAGVDRGSMEVPVKDLAANGDLPASTLAAQIVDQLASSQSNIRHHDRESFNLLLEEILDVNRNVWNAAGDAGDAGAETAINSKLICVLVRAGLRGAPDGLPAEEYQQNVVDVLKTLEAIDLTLSRSPTALFHQVPPIDSQLDPRLPLFAWLIPRLLQEVRSIEFDAIEQNVADVIKRALLIWEKSGFKNRNNYHLPVYIQSFITGSKNMVADPLLGSALCLAFTDLLSLIKSSSSISVFCVEHLSLPLSDLVNSQDQFDRLGKEVQAAMMATLRQLDNDSTASTKAVPSGIHKELTKSRVPFPEAIDCEIRHEIGNGTDVRPTKRLRHDSSSPALDGNHPESILCQQILLASGLQEVTALFEIDPTAIASFMSLDETDQCNLFSLLGQMACCKAGSLQLTSVPRKGRSTRLSCVTCDEQLSWKSGGNKEPKTADDSMVKVLAHLIKHPQLHKSRKARVAALLALPRILCHFQETHQLDLTASILGQYCLQALRSSSRDVRIAAGRVLPSFLRSGIEEDLLERNRVSAIDFLRNLSEKSELALQETCILAWGQIMRQVAQYLSDLLSVSVSELLRLTQAYTLPHLVLTKQAEVLKRVADACNRSIKELCMEPTNMPAILAYIILRSSNQAEIAIMASYQAISPDFVNIDCSELVKSEPVLIASELLKSAGDAEESTSPRASEGIHFLASLMYGKHGTPRGSARKNSMTGSFFESHVLGIMAHLSDTINESKGLQIPAERIRCLRAIREMMRIAKSNVNNALPQISACLRSAIETPELCNAAFISWMAMMNILEPDEVLALLDPTFAIVVQYWDSFTTRSQAQAYDMIGHLLRTQSVSIREVVYTIPSLASIPIMAKFEAEISNLKNQMAAKHRLQALIQRSQHENLTVVTRALEELESFLEMQQSFVHEIATTEPPDPVLSGLARTLIDICIQYNESNASVVLQSARCLGLVGCLDPTRTEAPREKKEVFMLSNFQDAEETVDFIMFFLQEVLVKAFLSATNPRAQGFLAYAMQELLKFCGLDNLIASRNQEKFANANYLRWVALPESVRNNLTPFLNSKYVVTAATVQPQSIRPIYRPSMGHRQWLQTLVYDLLQNGQGDDVEQLFRIFSRIIRTQDTPISTFLLPFAALNAVISGPERQQLDIAEELLTILSHQLPAGDVNAQSSLIQCSQNVFQVLDYFSRWIQEKKKEISLARTSSARHGRTPTAGDVETTLVQIHQAEFIVNSVPADIISRRAVECKSFARALFYWEQYIREQELKNDSGDSDGDMEPLYERLQQIYTQIDEPDGIEGISSHLQGLSVDQQIMEHRKAGRWTAAQSWYELLLSERPQDPEVQCDLLTCLRESGQHDALLNQIDGFESAPGSFAVRLPFACEACWVTGKWDRLAQYLAEAPASLNSTFNVGVGRALLALAQDDEIPFWQLLNDVRSRTARGLSTTNTMSLQACHEVLLKLHALTEIESIAKTRKGDSRDQGALMSSLDQRLNLLGALSPDKQYLLGLRRATMQLSTEKYSNDSATQPDHVARRFSDIDLASTWLTSAKLARKAGFIHQAFNAVLRASQLGDESATIEHSRLLWKEGHHRKAIQSLKGAIAANAFQSSKHLETEQSLTVVSHGIQQEQNIPKAQAHLLLARWVDGAGQTGSDSIRDEYKEAIRWHMRYEKAHYWLGKHYNKLFEYEKAKQPTKRAQSFLSGETIKLVVENYLRSLAYGVKYIHQTLPRALTLWLELGVEAEQPLDSRHGNDEFRTHTAQQRRRILAAVNAQMKKYCDRLPGFVFYTALSQIVARIVHPNPTVFPLLVEIVAKVVASHPQQALWTLLAVVKSSSKERALRGRQCLDKIHEIAKKSKGDMDGKELKAIINHGQKLSDQLLHVCEGNISGKPSVISLTKDLGFVHKMAPCRLVVPLESTLTASFPSGTEKVDLRRHRAFPRETVTISVFLDNALVLNSLQKPRKISIRGSDGHVYAMLCKPKDDLRKDQRLMEFNAMINRFLKKDAESSKRRLYIKTYAVTPLNEECGLIEWVDNLKTLREILMSSYRQKNIMVNYPELKVQLAEACSSQSKTHIFTDQILPRFPPVFHEWFVDMFPEPGAWFDARLRYTRSCAVMSIVGHVLGLGDRHGENILFEESNGGTLHVDFNCLFDKGITFEKPELVPFRLTQNMVDAFGAYGIEGPFRKSCEFTLRILRQHEDTLMTILETFLYDPTTDFMGKKKKREEALPDTPEGVLESVRNKVRGLLPRESVPLSVDGYTEELIKQATDPEKLAAMYIGWCAFF
ncbi:MAG: hypothetical protein Q9220_000958 [cf. Caloplaca sp. 1 TL-2023]